MKRQIAAVVASLSLVCLSTAALAAEPIKMLNLDIFSGPFKPLGERGRMGIQLAVQEINAKGGIDGRKIEIVEEDHEFKPETAQRKATKHILDGSVSVILVANSTPVIKSLLPLASRHKIIIAVYAGDADELTGSDFSPYLFRLSAPVSQRIKTTLAAMKDVKFKKVYLINQDYAYGHSAAEGYKKYLDRMRPGWELVGNDFAPIANKDFAPYIQKIIASGAEVVLTANFGPDLATFMKQAKQFGLKIPVGNINLSDPTVLKEVDTAAIGDITSDTYMVGIENPKNTAFIERWKAKYNKTEYPIPDYSSGKAYNMFQFLAAAIGEAKSTKAEDIIKTWEGMKFDGIIGSETMRVCDHQVQAPVAYATIVAGPTKYYSFASPAEVRQLSAEESAVAPADTGNPRCK